MREDAMDALDDRILSDDTLSNLSVAEQINWRDLPIRIIADLVIRYFGQRPDSGETLTQSFDKVVFQFRRRRKHRAPDHEGVQHRQPQLRSGEGYPTRAAEGLGQAD